MVFWSAAAAGRRSPEQQCRDTDQQRVASVDHVSLLARFLTVMLFVRLYDNFSDDNIAQSR
jgi:hypothetical protein